MGLLDAVQHRLPRQRARPARGTASCGVNAELNLTDVDGPDSQPLPGRSSRSTRRTSPLGSFSQMGFVEASIAVKALLGDQGRRHRRRPSTRRSRTSRTSRPTSSASPGTTATARCTSRTTSTGPSTPKNGKMVEKEECFDISDADPAISEVREIEAQQSGIYRQVRARQDDQRTSIVPMPSLEDFKPFIVTGLALGGVYALSGVGMVVLYRATGVLNLAFGAVGAMGALHRLVADQRATAGRRRPPILVCVLLRRRRHAALRRALRPAARGPRPARQGHGDARAGADPARRRCRGSGATRRAR